MKLFFSDFVPCGAAHITRALQHLGDEAALGNGDDDAAKPTAAEKSGQSVIAMRRLSPDELPGLNKYELLGLDKLGIGVDADVLKRAYHKALLTYHPDKNAADQEAEEDEVFLAVQEAHAMLSDPTRRRAYDSTNEFDDSIPSGREADVQGSAFDFYATYAPVFRSNARFSTNPRVPDLGDDDSSNEEVQKFYEFWARFESWRDYSLDEPEHDVEQAECREERRWMEKENMKISKKKKVDEYSRITTLVDRARTNDPRLKRAREAEQRAKLEAKEARLAQARQREDEERQKREEEVKVAEEQRKRNEEEKQVAKDALVKEKKAARKAKNLLRKVHADKDTAKELSEDDIEFLCDNLETADAINAAAALFEGGDLAAVHDLVITTRERLLNDKAKDDRDAEAARANQMEAMRATMHQWTEDERSCLAKAAGKFPAGAQQRWNTIANYINTTLSLKQPLTGEECIKEYKDVQGALGRAGLSGAGPTRSAGVSTTAVSRPAVAAPADDIWSDAQQKQLEAALAANPASMETNERWKAIAAAVEGKTKKECVARFKLLREKLRGSK